MSTPAKVNEAEIEQKSISIKRYLMGSYSWYNCCNFFINTTKTNMVLLDSTQ